MNIIGIDVSKAKLDCAWFRDENKVKAKVVANRLDGWEELIKVGAG
jgi:transposase